MLHLSIHSLFSVFYAKKAGAIEKPLPASIISVSTALIFPVILICALWPLGLTGIWLNFAGASLLAAVLSLILLYRLRGELRRPDAVI